jgi:hypothetical protein
VYAPIDIPGGMVNVALKFPCPAFVVIVLGVVVCTAELNVIVITDPPANPVPVTVIVVDDGLVWRMLLGVIEILGTRV